MEFTRILSIRKMKSCWKIFIYLFSWMDACACVCLFWHKVILYMCGGQSTISHLVFHLPSFLRQVLSLLSSMLYTPTKLAQEHHLVVGALGLTTWNPVSGFYLGSGKLNSIFQSIFQSHVQSYLSN